jgi:hypothetical protein
LNALLKTNVVDGTLGPDDIELLAGERQIVHGACKRGYAVCNAVAIRSFLQHIEKIL